MVEKIIITPEKVRAYGNVVSPHTLNDYETYNSSLSEGTATINNRTMTVYTGTYEPPTINVTLSASSNTVNIGASITLTATVTDEDDEPMENATVTFKVDGSTIDTASTNSSGVATLSYTCNTAGSLSFTASVGSSTSTAATVTVNKLSTSTSLSTSGNNVLVGTSVTLTATVTSSSTPIEGLTVTFKDGNNTLSSSLTNSSGVATYTSSSLSVATHSITAVVTETSTYATSTSSSVSVVVYDHSYSLAFSSSTYTATSGSATLSVTLLDNNVAVSGATVSVAGSDSSLYSGITNSSGTASVTVSNISSDTTFTASYSGATATCTVTTSNIIFEDSTEYTETAIPSGDTRVNIIPNFNFDASVDFEMTCDVYFSKDGSGFGLFPVSPNTYQYHFNYGQNADNESVYYGNSNGGESAVRKYGTQSFNEWFTLKYVKVGYQVTTYKNGTLFSNDIPTTTLGDHGNMMFAFGFWGSRTSHTGKVKNLKIVQI